MHYYLAVAGQQYGPFSREQLLDKPPPPGALVWREGMTQWLPAEQVTEIQRQTQTVSSPAPPDFDPHDRRGPPAAEGQPQRSWLELRHVATSQRRLILGIGLSTLAYLIGLPTIAAIVRVLGQVFGLPPEEILAVDAVFEWSLILTLCGAQVWLAVQVAKSLKLRNAWVWGVGSCLCCVGLIVLLVLNQKATSALQRAGIAVGFFGADLPEQQPPR